MADGMRFGARLPCTALTLPMSPEFFTSFWIHTRHDDLRTRNRRAAAQRESKTSLENRYPFFRIMH
jgi:hypothetical protein